jgi:sulfonate transport system substrate-binding protein
VVHDANRSRIAGGIAAAPRQLRVGRRVLLTSAIGVAIFGHARAGAEIALWPADVPRGTSLVAADQNEVMQTLMIASGEQAKLASQVTYANCLGDPAILEAFRAGALDLASVGNAPPVQAQAAGERIPIVAAVLTSAVDYRFATRPGLKTERLEDLRGKRITYGEGTGRQPFVLYALKQAGLTRDDVTLVPLRAGDFPDAVRGGQVDVAVLNEPHYSRYLADYANRGASALPEREYARLPQGLSYLYASETALRNSAKAAAIAEFVAHWIAAKRWSKANPDAWIGAYYVADQHLSQADGKRIEDAERGVSFPLLRSMVGRQQAIADLIYDAGDIPQRLDARDEFDLRFDTVIAANAV